MTEEQIKKYEDLKRDIGHIQNFIDNLNGKHRNNMYGIPYLPKEHKDFIIQYLEIENQKLKDQIPFI